MPRKVASKPVEKKEAEKPIVAVPLKAKSPGKASAKKAPAVVDDAEGPAITIVIDDKKLDAALAQVRGWTSGRRRIFRRRSDRTCLAGTEGYGPACFTTSYSLYAACLYLRAGCVEDWRRAQRRRPERCHRLHAEGHEGRERQAHPG